MKPVILPAAEKVKSNRFTISSIVEIMKFFANESEVGVTIKTRRLVSIFEKILVNEKYRVMLPDNWRSLTIERLQNFITKFDKAGKGEIELWIVSTVVALTDASVANNKNIEEFCLLATGHNPTIKQISK